MVRILAVGAVAALGPLGPQASAREVELQAFPASLDHGGEQQAVRPPIGPDALRNVAMSAQNAAVPILAPNACQTARWAPQPRLSAMVQMRRLALYPAITLAACAEGVPPALLDALIARESRYNPAAISPKGAIGLTQLLPATASALGTGNPWSTYANLKGGARYLRQQLDTFGRYDLALAAYNAGPGNVRRHKGVPPFAETRGYVDDVLATLLRGRPLAMPMPRSSGAAGLRSLSLSVYPAPVLLPRMIAP